MRVERRALMMMFEEIDHMSNQMMRDELSKLDIWVYWRIHTHCWSNKKGICTKSLGHFAAESGKSKASIKASLKRLTALKFITQIYRVQTRGKIKTIDNLVKLEKFREKNSAKILGCHYSMHPRIKSFVSEKFKS